MKLFTHGSFYTKLYFLLAIIFLSLLLFVYYLKKNQNNYDNYRNYNTDLKILENDKSISKSYYEVKQLPIPPIYREFERYNSPSTMNFQINDDYQSAIHINDTYDWLLQAGKSTGNIYIQPNNNQSIGIGTNHLDNDKETSSTTSIHIGNRDIPNQVITTQEIEHNGIMQQSTGKLIINNGTTNHPLTSKLPTNLSIDINGNMNVTNDINCNKITLSDKSELIAKEFHIHNRNSNNLDNSFIQTPTIIKTIQDGIVSINKTMNVLYSMINQTLNIGTNLQIKNNQFLSKTNLELPNTKKLFLNCDTTTMNKNCVIDNLHVNNQLCINETCLDKKTFDESRRIKNEYKFANDILISNDTTKTINSYSPYIISNNNNNKQRNILTNNHQSTIDIGNRYRDSKITLQTDELTVDKLCINQACIDYNSLSIIKRIKYGYLMVEDTRQFIAYEIGKNKNMNLILLDSGNKSNLSQYLIFQYNPTDQILYFYNTDMYCKTSNNNDLSEGRQVIISGNNDNKKRNKLQMVYDTTLPDSSVFTLQSISKPSYYITAMKKENNNQKKGQQIEYFTNKKANNLLKQAEKIADNNPDDIIEDVSNNESELIEDDMGDESVIYETENIVYSQEIEPLKLRFILP